MTTPNTANSSIALSQINGELNFPTTTPRNINDMILRELTGVAAKTGANTPINLSDLSNKTAFGGLVATSSSNTVSDFGSVSPTLTFSTTSDLVDPVITWTTNVVSGWQDVTVIKDNPKKITLRLNLANPGFATSNVFVGVSVSYAGHIIGQANQYVTLTGTVYDPLLSFTGNTNVNVQGYTAQTATTTLVASSNSTVNTSIAFVVNPTNGVTISGNSVIFTVPASTVTTDNTVVYSVTTNVLYKGMIIASNTQNVTVRAVFNGADFNFVVPATSNNQFANSGSISSSLSVLGSHNIPGANIVWSYAKTSGTDATFTVDASKANSTITLSVANGTFGMSKGIYNVTATLQYSNGYVLNTKTTQLTLRTGSYGLSVNQDANIALSGYQAQSAIVSSAFSWGAGSFALDYALVSGTLASVSKTISGNTASVSIAEYANTMGTTAASVYSVTPTISFDGIVISNNSITQSVSASYLPYTFSVTGPTVNNQIGTGTVASSILLSGAHNIPNGSISWTSSNPNITLSSNTTSANLSISSTTINAQTATVTANLLDGTGRTVTTKSFPVTLRAFAPNVSFTGDTTVSVSGYAATQVALASIAATCGVAGSNTFAINAVKVSGNDLNITNYTGNTTTDQISLEITATANSIGTQSGTYQLQAVVGYYDATFIATQNVTVSATTIDPQFTLTPSGQTVSDYSPPVVANGSVSSTFVVPNGKINWSYTGGTPTSVTSNNTAFSYNNSQNNVGYSNINLSVTGTLVDGNNLFVASKKVNVITSAQFIAAIPTLSGTTSVSESNLFNASATTTLTASVAAGVTGQTYQFSTSLVSGTAPSINVGANSVSLSLSSAGIQSKNCVIDVTCNVIISGLLVGTSTKRVNLSAVCPAPTMNYSVSPDSGSAYTYPVTNIGSISASMPQGGYVIVSYSSINSSLSVGTTNPPNFGSVSSSGTVNLGAGGSLYFGARTSSVGTVSGTYTITYNFYSPDGLLLKTTSNQITVSSTRLNPNFSFNYGGPSSVTKSGWLSDGTLQAIVSMQAYNNSDIPNLNYVFTATLTSGSPANFNYNNSSGACNVQLIATNDTSKSCNYNITCTLRSGTQVIAGPLSLNTFNAVTPYYINVASVFNDDETDAPSSSNIGFTSNYPNWGSVVTFNATQVSANRVPSISVSQSGSIVYWTMAYNPQPPSKGTYSCSYNVTPVITGHSGTTQNVTMQCTIISPTGTCVAENMFLDKAYRARDVIEGMVFDTWTPEDGFTVDFVNSVSGPHKVPCVRIKTESGAVLECTYNTKFNLKIATKDLEDFKYAMDMKDELVLVNIYGETFWERVTEVTSIGEQNVMKIDFGGKSYAAGEKSEKRIFSHNLKFIPPE